MQITSSVADMIPAFIDKSKIPHKSGVYLFKDAKKRILYVGKALDLYHRVSSYFTSSGKLDIKTTTFVPKITNIDTIVVESELEALILEANLIKKYLPPYNIRLTDDKDYLYIKITKEPFPKVVTARKQDLKNYIKYFGPFPSARTVKDTLKSLRKVFPWCSNPTPPANISYRLRPCFYYHLRLCSGPCAQKVTQKDYRKIINRFIAFMEGKKDKLLADLIKQMTQASNRQEYEEAVILRKQIEGVQYLTQPAKTHVYLENPNFVEDQRRLGLQELKKALSLVVVPSRIEGYDISNISGKEATGSMVVLTNGEIDKSQYRKFKIRISGRVNDVAMMQEMVQRRLKHQEWKIPDLLLIDGGKGQVNAIFNILNSHTLNIPVYGLAKRMEWLYSPAGDIIKLPRTNPAIKLLQKLRDEAHRFAINYHRKLRSRALLQREVLYARLDTVRR